MSMPTIMPSDRTIAKLGRVVRVCINVVVLVGLVLIVAGSPFALQALSRSERDWVTLGNIGQAYGPISALLSAAALCVVVLVQRKQLQHERVWTVRGMHMAVLQTALDDPKYGQCWGPRVTPEKVDERFFYYVNSIIVLWGYLWESGELRDEHIRAYAKAMFDSEIPRLYWRMHGGWRTSSACGERRRFLLLLDAEFRAAEAAGPPTRPVEYSAPQMLTIQHRNQRYGASRVQLHARGGRIHSRKMSHSARATVNQTSGTREFLT
jgi:hypothetical protein